MTATNVETLEPRTWNDTQLLERLLHHDAQAWREFHRRFDRLIFRCVHQVTSRFRGVVGNEDVREIYSQLLLNLTARNMRRLRSFDPERGNKLSSWIGLLATNAAWDYLRSLSRRPSCVELDDELSLSAGEPDPHQRAEDRERLRRVNDVLSRFSVTDQTFVRLYFVDGRSPDEIATTMNISVKTVYSKKHKIRTRLEGELGGVASAA
jgi:RNA polymerase sigma-70 factor (ECF subfamily)